MAEVVTGEAVVVEMPLARFPSRLVARALDMVIQGAVLLTLTFGLVVAFPGADAAAAQALTLTVVVLVLVGYPVIWETATRGATPGKFALGLRVVSDDGGPVRFRQALVRGLVGAFELWPLAFVALLCSLLSADGKRAGDFAAGTRVVQRRLPAPALVAPAFAAVPPALAAWAVSLELSSLSDAVAETARQYLSRLPSLSPAARDELGWRLATAMSAQVSPPPPPGTPPVFYLAAVLAERGRRSRARLAAPGYAAPAWPGPAAAVPPAAVPPAASAPAWQAGPAAVPPAASAPPVPAPPVPATPVIPLPGIPIPEQALPETPGSPAGFAPPQ